MLRKLVASLWLVFVAWMLVYAMYASVVFGLAGAWAIWPSRQAAPTESVPARRGVGRRVVKALVLLGGLLAVPVVGFPEYAATTNRLHCRTLGFMGTTAPRDCAARDLAEGRRVAQAGGPLYGPRERLGVHGFNHVLALGGFASFLPEVAWETLWMSWAPDPFADTGGATRAPLAARRAQCAASYGPPRDAGARLAPERVEESEVASRSPKVQKRIAAGLPRLGKAPGSTLDLGEVHFAGPGGDLEAYTHSFLNDSLRAALALEVGDSRVSLHRLDDGAVEARWTGIIHYPGEHTAFEVPFPQVFGPPFMLRVSETAFCGMQVDGAMNPFVLTYTWRL